MSLLCHLRSEEISLNFSHCADRLIARLSFFSCCYDLMHEKKKNNSRRKGVVLFYTSGRQSIVLWRSQWQEFGATGHIIPAFKRRVVNACTQLKVSRTSAQGIVPTTEETELVTPINLFKVGMSPVSQVTLYLKLRIEINQYPSHSKSGPSYFNHCSDNVWIFLLN